MLKSKGGIPVSQSEMGDAAFSAAPGSRSLSTVRGRLPAEPCSFAHELQAETWR